MLLDKGTWFLKLLSSWKSHHPSPVAAKLISKLVAMWLIRGLVTVVPSYHPLLLPSSQGVDLLLVTYLVAMPFFQGQIVIVLLWDHWQALESHLAATLCL